MQVLSLAIRAMTWIAIGYLWRDRIAYRERLRAQLVAAPPPPFAPAPPPEVIDLPALAPPPEVIHLPALAPSAAPAPLAKRHSRTMRLDERQSRAARHVLAVIVTGVATGAFAVWVLSAVPLP